MMTQLFIGTLKLILPRQLYFHYPTEFIFQVSILDTGNGIVYFSCIFPDLSTINGNDISIPV
jgi:hypothetical protein